MIGAHLDSWHGGTGATDNATGSAVCLEAIRILRALDVKPRRTIRIGLWGGEEQGLLGSQAYVRTYLGTQNDSTRTVTFTPQGEKFCVYFNDDNGTGRFRGVYMQGNEAVRPIFRQWLTAITTQRRRHSACETPAPPIMFRSIVSACRHFSLFRIKSSIPRLPIIRPWTWPTGWCRRIFNRAQLSWPFSLTMPLCASNRFLVARNERVGAEG